jgi:uncharacterized repeat protein (TIGR04076 family)
MYKVTCRVVKVGEPKAIEGKEAIPVSAYALFNVEDRMIFATFPTRLILEECDNVCIFALNTIAPAAQALCRETAEEEDDVKDLSYFCCPDAHRPVIFRIEREKLSLEKIKLSREKGYKK